MFAGFSVKKTQDRAEKPGCIFIFMGGQDILSALVCVRWRTGRFESGRADFVSGQDNGR